MTAPMPRDGDGGDYPVPAPKPERRKGFPWFWTSFGTIQAIFVIWFITGANAIHSDLRNCGTDGFCRHDAIRSNLLVFMFSFIAWLALDALLLAARAIRQNRKRQADS